MRVSESVALNGYWRTELRRLAVVVESNVHPAIAGQEDESLIAEHPLPICGTQLGVVVQRILPTTANRLAFFCSDRPCDSFDPRVPKVL